MKFFIDNNLGKDIANGMKGFGENVMHLTDKFNQAEADAVWLPYVGENEMTLVTRDLKVRRRPYELSAIKRYKVGVFFLGGKNLTRCELIQQIVRNWPEMKRFGK